MHKQTILKIDSVEHHIVQPRESKDKTHKDAKNSACSYKSSSYYFFLKNSMVPLCPNY